MGLQISLSQKGVLADLALVLVGVLDQMAPQIDFRCGPKVAHWTLHIVILSLLSQD